VTPPAETPPSQQLSPAAPHEPTVGTLDYTNTSAHDPRYTVGSLQYTKASLAVMFFWMIFGNIAFGLMEQIFPISMPLQLSRLGVPDAWMPVLMVTCGQSMNMVLSPIISFRSDRTRSRWGRRIPYIIITLPFLCLCLVALGFTDEIGAYVRHAPWIAHLGLSPLTCVLLAIGALVVLYNFFNDFVNTVYWYLFADVIPVAFLGRFTGLSSVVGSAAGAAFSYFVYGQIKDHSRAVYIGAAILYAVGMGLLCWRVREGKYPPPTDEPRTAPFWRRMLADIRTYFRECFCHPIYITYYVYNALRALTNCTSFAIIFFYIDYLGFSMDHMGKFRSILAIVTMAISFPAGWLVDRIHPMRATLWAAALVIPLNAAAFFTNSFTMYMILGLLRLPVNTLMSTAGTPFNVELLPRNQYGQFCSANDMLRSFVLIFGSVAGGLFVGYSHDHYGLAGYAGLWIWVVVFDILAMLCLLVLWQYWRRMGGENFSFDPETGKAYRQETSA
jgi:MFS family permease